MKGTGQSYGEFTVIGAGSSTDILSFSLNAAAISDINTAIGEFFSIGGSLLTLDGTTFGPFNDEILFGSSGGLGTQRLVLEGDDLVLETVTMTTVPEPSTLALFAIGLTGLGFFGWRRRTALRATAP